VPPQPRRAPLQVLVIPYLVTDDGVRYALFRRADAGYWQGVAGGGDDDESPLEAARRELAEEAGLGPETTLLPLDSRTTIPVVDVTGELSFGPDVLVIPEYAFGACCSSPGITLCDEHTEYAWFDYAEARRAVRWDSNRNALWELDHRLRRGDVA